MVRRSLEATWAAPCGEFQVTTSLNNYAVIGQVAETFPHGFTFVRTSLDDSQVEVDGRTLSFYLLDDSRFTYVLAVSEVREQYAFSGDINNADREGQAISGDAVLRIGIPPTPEPSAIPTGTPEAPLEESGGLPGLWWVIPVVLGIGAILGSTCIPRRRGQ